MSRPVITIAELADHADQDVTLKGWVYNWRKKGKLRFIILRDGFGYLQCVVFKPEVEETVWDTAVELTQESSITITLRPANVSLPGGGAFSANSSAWASISAVSAGSTMGCMGLVPDP